MEKICLKTLTHVLRGGFTVVLCTFLYNAPVFIFLHPDVRFLTCKSEVHFFLHPDVRSFFPLGAEGTIKIFEINSCEKLLKKMSEIFKENVRIFKDI